MIASSLTGTRVTTLPCGIRRSARNCRLTITANQFPNRDAYTDKNIPKPSTGKRHFLHVDDFSSDELRAMLISGIEIKKKFQSGDTSFKPFKGKTMAMVFAKPSMRTLMSFQTGFYLLGGMAIYLGPDMVGIGKREAAKDVARVLSQYNDMIMARLFAHENILELAEFSSVPVINGLTDYNHPCQIMADAQTVIETLGSLEGRKVVFIGDGNNIVHSWARLASKLPFHFVNICPPGYEPDRKTIELANAAGVGKIEVSHDIGAVKGADVVYTDVWASMGQKDTFAQRVKDFAGFTVDNKIMELAGPKSIFMHCLPAERGVEVTDEVIESKRSVVFQEAGNRQWAQMAIMAYAMSGIVVPK